MEWPPSLGAAFSTVISAFPVTRKRMNGEFALSFKIIDLKATHITFRIIFSPETTKQMDKILKMLVSRNWTLGN